MSFPHSAGQGPISYAEPPTGRPIDKIGIDVAGDHEADGQGRRVFRKFTTACRLEGPHTPLYPFGHGLGYSVFEYGALEPDQSVLRGANRSEEGRVGEERVSKCRSRWDRCHEEKTDVRQSRDRDINKHNIM